MVDREAIFGKSKLKRRLESISRMNWKQIPTEFAASGELLIYF